MSHPAIIIEHDDFVVVNKPSGVSMHQGSNAHNNKNVQTILAWALQIGLTCPLYLVHRLDTHTSGCLLLAKHKSPAAALSALFENRQITKFYIALSDKKSSKKQGRISTDMVKSRNGSYKLASSTKSPAVTFFQRQTLNQATKLVSHAPRYLYYLKPITGKTHQLRVALKSLGSTILGDSRYKGAVADRLYLHSLMLNFTYLGENFSCTALPTQGAFFDKDLLGQMKDPTSFNWPRYQHPNRAKNRVENAKNNMIEYK
ncbi:pseudouridine synthase [Glaciecola petra]|uniref:Pseudouridine synthase n=1 Tax=Glaciecola petra TaxID=3075602 RepID=A0ABU2ZMP4_9ALTE|nr:pseudouridine synthase [Aestuariibacter sp. P117]MDT0593895.1 pseudouridine synthase [Aestuariibacter sp. P117]